MRRVGLMRRSLIALAVAGCGDAVSTGPVTDAHYDWYGANSNGSCGIRDGEASCGNWTSGVRSPSFEGLQVREIAIGWDQLCALATDGEVYCQGGSQYHGSPGPPPGAEDDPRFTRIALREEQGCALSEDGRIWCWGSNYRPGGIFGWPVPELPGWCDEAGQSCDYATPMPAPPRFDDFGVGTVHACGLSDGEVWCWGSPEHGALGRDDDEGALACDWGPCFPPRRVPGLPRIEQLAVTPGGGCGLTGAGRAWCWGAGGATPAAVPGLFETLTGGYQACALAANRVVYCWAPAGEDNSATDPAAVVPGPVPEFVFDRLLPSLGSSCGSNRVTGVACWYGRNPPVIVPGQDDM